MRGEGYGWWRDTTNLTLVSTDVNWDEGAYFDTRPDSPPIWHHRIQCEAGRSIPEDFVKHTFNMSDLGARHQCPECNSVLDLDWAP